MMTFYEGEKIYYTQKVFSILLLGVASPKSANALHVLVYYNMISAGRQASHISYSSYMYSPFSL